MKIRLILLVVVAGGLAIAFAVRSSAPPQSGAPETEDAVLAGERGVSLEQYRLLQTSLDRRELSGREPEVGPEFIVEVSVDPTGRKNRAFVDISETHGFYVETFRIGVFFKSKPETTLDDSPLTVEHFADQFIPANGTLRTCIDFNPNELNKVGGVMGLDENWHAEVLTYGRAREANPNPLPEQAEAFDCR